LEKQRQRGLKVAANLSAFRLAVTNGAQILSVAGFIMHLDGRGQLLGRNEAQADIDSSGQAMREPWRCPMICTYYDGSISETCVLVSGHT
jgi:hypothetical protein